MATAPISTRFRFGAQPHGSAAAAARYFDRLAALELAGCRPTPAEAREIVTARRAYIRVSTGFARRLESARSLKPTTDIIFIQKEFRRPRERRSAPSRAVIGRDDGDDEPAERRHHALACGGFAIASGKSS